MGIAIDRRRFLLGLVGLGASVVLPAEASMEQVEAEWARLVADPWYFTVDDHGTLLESDEGLPEVNRDVYDISTKDITTVPDLVVTVDQHVELSDRFERLAEVEAEDCQDWEAWIECEGRDGLPRFRAQIDKWLDTAVDWERSEFWPDGRHNQRRVMNFFAQMDVTVCEALGVVIIEGECPGSSYYAAELRRDFDTANLAAERLGLPFRFRLES